MSDEYRQTHFYRYVAESLPPYAALLDALFVRFSNESTLEYWRLSSNDTVRDVMLDTLKAQTRDLCDDMVIESILDSMPDDLAEPFIKHLFSALSAAFTFGAWCGARGLHDPARAIE